MRQGKYTVVGGKYVHQSDLSLVRAKQVFVVVIAAVAVAMFFYSLSFCI